MLASPTPAPDGTVSGRPTMASSAAVDLANSGRSAPKTWRTAAGRRRPEVCSCCGVTRPAACCWLRPPPRLRTRPRRRARCRGFHCGWACRTFPLDPRRELLRRLPRLRTRSPSEAAGASPRTASRPCAPHTPRDPCPCGQRCHCRRPTRRRGRPQRPQPRAGLRAVAPHVPAPERSGGRDFSNCRLTADDESAPTTLTYPLAVAEVTRPPLRS